MEEIILNIIILTIILVLFIIPFFIILLLALILSSKRIKVCIVLKPYKTAYKQALIFHQIKELTREDTFKLGKEVILMGLTFAYLFKKRYENEIDKILNYEKINMG